MNKNAEFIAWLKRARALVEKGWTQGAYHNAGCYCARGALNTAAPLVPLDWRLVGPDSDHGLVHWNDMQGRTQAEVIAMFDNSIKALEEV